MLSGYMNEHFALYKHVYSLHAGITTRKANTFSNEAASCLRRYNVRCRSERILSTSDREGRLPPSSNLLPQACCASVRRDKGELYEHYNIGTIIHYSCKYGYVLVGSSWNRCVRKQWHAVWEYVVPICRAEYPVYV